ncbi:LytTR family transcriptional regulator [Stenotrophomonas panacihumi]|nr:LytTR family transcriptional regulator [Stenotrophomonas panacihumi]
MTMQAAPPPPPPPPPSNAESRSRRWVVVFWIVVFLSAGLGNAATGLMDAQRDGLPIAAWQLLTWELSSVGISLALLPLVLAACARWPLHADNWRRRLPLYLLGSVVWSVLHVAGMVAVRKAVYALLGDHYDFGDIWVRWGYEYLKDVRTFALLVITSHAAAWFGRRLQGEARLFDLPDEGPPLEPVERPERFLVRKLGRDFLVAAADIEWLQAAGNYVNLHLRGHDYPLRSTLAGIEARLDPAVFVRVHRSYLVNLGRVVSIEPQDSGDASVHMDDGSVLPCSRRYLPALRDAAA